MNRTDLADPAAPTTTTTAGAVVSRSIAISFEDGGTLTIAATAELDDHGHDSERIRAELAEPHGETIEFGEALLSTEYGPDGIQRRATLELWPEREGAGQAVRGAGRALDSEAMSVGRARDRTAPTRRLGTLATQPYRDGSSVELEPNAVSALTRFEWSVDGRPGVGEYEIIRRQ